MGGQRRGWLLAAILTLLGITGLVVGGAWLWATRRNNPLHAAAIHQTTPATLSSDPTRPQCRSPLTPDRPLRLWIGGDSLAGSLGPALGEKTAHTGVVAPTFDSRPSSGLASPSFFNWPEHATTEMARLNPEVVVFIMGTNDFSFTESTRVDAQGVPEWRVSYARLVEQILGILGRNGRPVIWIGAPTLRDGEKDSGVRKVNEVAREVVERNADATYVDAYKLFSGLDGGYAATLPGVDGVPTRVRTSDGIHFTTKGAELLSAHVFALLDARCHIRDQKVLDHPQPVHEAPGSSQLPVPKIEPKSTSTTTSTPTSTTTPASTPSTSTTTTSTTGAPTTTSHAPLVTTSLGLPPGCSALGSPAWPTRSPLPPRPSPTQHAWSTRRAVISRTRRTTTVASRSRSSTSTRCSHTTSRTRRAPSKVAA